MKKVIHIDADCFYASVEIRENPKLAGLPIAVGGSPDGRGVIATCNYEARKFGVRSAMSSAYARELCPTIQFLPPRISLYKEYSRQMRDVFLEYTEIIEPLSLDEAYMDVSCSDKLQASATLIAKEIRAKVYQQLGISVSAGVAPVKYLAKIASDWNKPNGLFVVTPEQVKEFVLPLSVRRLPGVGPVTAGKMARNGLYTCADIKKYGLEKLTRLFGSHGQRLFKMSMGVDDRLIEAREERKSLSVERTYERDFMCLQDVFPFLQDLLNVLELRYARLESDYRVKKLFVKVKFNDFSSTTVEATVGDEKQANHDRFHRLLCAGWYRKQIPIRLLGVGFRLESLSSKQLRLPFDQCNVCTKQ